MKNRTISKNFNDNEVIFKDSDGTIYLKQGVTRLKYTPLLEEIDSPFNEDLIRMERINDFRQAHGLDEDTCDDL
jgi:hypothetical protein